MVTFDIDIQRQLICAALDDFSANAALPNVLGGQYGATSDAWRQLVMQFICDAVKAGIIVALPGKEGYDLKSADELRDLLSHGDINNGLDASLLWDVIHFAGTKVLRDILSSYQLDNWNAMNSALSLELGRTLSDMRVVQVQ
jgi:hypothetical protein